MDTSEDSEAIPREEVTVDQIVALNMRYYRRAAALTQEELGQRLGWSPANVSAAERSASENRDRRRFDAQTITEVAVALGVPIIAFFLPPEDDGYTRHFLFRPGGGEKPAPMARLMELAIHDSDSQAPVMGAYRKRVQAAADFYFGSGSDWAREVARWFRPRVRVQVVIDRIARLRSQRIGLLDQAAETEDLADALEELLGDDVPEDET